MLRVTSSPQFCEVPSLLVSPSPGQGGEGESLLAPEWDTSIVTVGPAMWLRSDVVTLSAGKVAMWPDQSGHGRHVRQANAVSQPAWSAFDYYYQYKPILNFATAKWLASSAFAQPVSQPCTWYVVGETSPNVADYRVLVDGIDGNRHIITSNVVTGEVYAYAGSALNTDVLGGSPHVHCVVMPAYGVPGDYYVNSYGTSNAHGTVGTNTLSGVTIGAIAGGGGAYLNGKVAEVLLFPEVHNEAQRHAVMTYLSNRYSRPLTWSTRKLRLWLDSVYGLATSGTKVTGWADQTGYGHHVAQATAINQPDIVYANDLALKPAVSWPGTTSAQVWLNNTTDQVVAQSAARTVICVSVPSQADGGTVIDFRRAAPDSAYLQVLLGGYVYGGSDNDYIANAPAIVGVPMVSVWRAAAGGSGGRVRYRQNATDYAPGVVFAMPNESAGVGFTIGAREPFSAYTFQGRIATILVFEEQLSDADVRSIEAFLIARYAAIGPIMAQPKLRLAAEAGIVLNGANVVTWVDQSLSEFDVSQPTALYQPVFNETDLALGGRSSVESDTTRWLLRNYSSPSLSATEYTIFAAVRWVALPGASYQFFASLLDANGYGPEAGVSYTNQRVINHSNLATGVEPTAPTVDLAEVITMRWSQAVPAVLSVDDVDHPLSVTGGGPSTLSYTPGFGRIAVLARYNGTVGAACAVAELRVYDRKLTDVESRAVTKQLLRGRTSLILRQPALWLDAALGVTLAPSTSQVAAWADQSGHGHHMLQPIPAKRPVLNATGYAGRLPCIEADGVDDFLQATFAIGTIKTLFVVGRWTSAWAGVSSTLIDGAVGNSARLFRDSATSLAMYSGGYLHILATGSTPWVAHRAVFNGAALSYASSGYLVASATASAVSANGLTLFAYGYDQDWAEAQIAEVIAFDVALSPLETEIVEEYLLAKYGL